MNTSRQGQSPPSGTSDQSPLAVVTGGSSGLGAALVTLVRRHGYRVITNGRNADRLADAAVRWDAGVRPLPGDVTDPEHRTALLDAVAELSASAEPRLDLLINNASSLGISPLTPIAETPAGVLHDTWITNVAAPIALTQQFLPSLLRGTSATIINISSDAATEHYPTWGAYAASKAALDHLTLTLAAELDDTSGTEAEPSRRLRVYAVDPGDMRTPMHQAAFPGEDISDRGDPVDSAAAILALIAQRPLSGRYRAADFAGHHTRTDHPASS